MTTTDDLNGIDLRGGNAIMNDVMLEKARIASTILARLQALTSRYAVAIAGIESSEEGTFVGTGTIIEFCKKVFLATAEHVVVSVESKGYLGLAYSSGDQKPFVRAPSLFVRDSGRDIAFVEIPRPREPSSDRAACPERLIAKSASGVETDWLFINGFPGQYSRFLKIVGGIHSRTLPFASKAVVPRWPDYDPSLHFAMRYVPQSCLGGDGKSMELPDPHGLSGVAVWNVRLNEMGASWQPADARIAGIVQKWDQAGECLIATRIEHIISFLEGNIRSGIAMV